MSTINTPMVFIVDTPYTFNKFLYNEDALLSPNILLFTFCLALLTVLVVVSINVATSVLSIVKYTSIHTFNSCGLNLLVRIFSNKSGYFCWKIKRSSCQSFSCAFFPFLFWVAISLNLTTTSLASKALFLSAKSNKSYFSLYL